MATQIMAAQLVEQYLEVQSWTIPVQTRVQDGPEEQSRVFLVDAHPVFRQGLRRILETYQHFRVVGEANSAEEALEQLEILSADVVVMDILLPGMDGMVATRRLKARHPSLKVVIVSALGQEHLLPSIEAGVDGYLLKTLNPEDLVHSLLRAAQGQLPIDPSLTRHLLDRVATSMQQARGPCLTPRQQEVLQLVAEGCSSRELASTLFISQATLKRDIRSIFDLLGVNDRAHAVAEACRRHLI